MKRRACLLLLVSWLTPVWSTPTPTEMAAGNTRFALELYTKLARKPGNLAFSPYSLSSALAMTSAGARGDTAAEMTRVLHLPEKESHAGFGALLNQLSQPHPDYKLLIANRLWPSVTLKLSQSFLDLLKMHYGASLVSLDFTGSDQARKQINNWVAE